METAMTMETATAMETENVEGDELETLVYLQVRKSGDPRTKCFNHSWHVMNESMSRLSEDPRLSIAFPRDTISACYDPDDDCAIKPTIFLCGGRRFFSDTDWNYHGSIWKIENPLSSQFSFAIVSTGFTYVYDPAFNYYGNKYLWFQGPSMIHARAHSNTHTHTHTGGCALVAADKVLYVFGGVVVVPKSPPPVKKLPWAEFYPIDGSCSYWSPLDPPSDTHVGPMPHVSACFQFNLETILVYFDTIGCIYALLLDSKQWTMFDSSFGKSFENLLLVPDLNILLATKDSVLYGYDLLCKIWFKDPVKYVVGNQLVLPKLHNHDQLPHSFHLVLLNSKGKICMVWANRCDLLSPLHVSCMKFTVFWKDSSLVAASECSQEFEIVDAEALVCCLPMKRKGGRPAFNPADETDIVAQDLATAQFEEALSETDKDNDGLISPADLRHAMVKLGQIVSDEQFGLMLSVIDVNKEGQINYVKLLRDYYW